VAGGDDRATGTRVFRGVVFDLDGTLLDTLTDLADCLNRVLQRHGLPTHPRDAFRMFIGDGLRMLVQRAMPADSRDPVRIDSLAAQMNAEYADHWADQTRPYEGIAEMLRGLVAGGLYLAVLSNKPDEFTSPAVRQFFPDIPFAVVRGARPEVPRKPDPAGALQIAAGAGLAPAEFLYLGDSGTDMQTAVRAGMFPVGVLWGFRDADELNANGAAHLLDHPRRLLTAFRFEPHRPPQPSH
jgi:phosphoglycolate phosphatase